MIVHFNHWKIWWICNIKCWLPCSWTPMHLARIADPGIFFLDLLSVQNLKWYMCTCTCLNFQDLYNPGVNIVLSSRLFFVCLFLTFTLMWANVSPVESVHDKERDKWFERDEIKLHIFTKWVINVRFNKFINNLKKTYKREFINTHILCMVVTLYSGSWMSSPFSQRSCLSATLKAPQ